MLPFLSVFDGDVVLLFGKDLSPVFSDADVYEVVGDFFGHVCGKFFEDAIESSVSSCLCS